MNKSKYKIFNCSLFKIKNKKADELISIWWFIIFGVVGLAIVYGTMTFYSFPLDMRGIEAEALSDKVSLCIFNNQDKFIAGGLDYFSDCGLNKEIINVNSDYFVFVSVNGEITKLGNPKFEELCKLKKSLLNAKSYPACAEKEFSIFEQGREYKIKLLAASDNKGVVSNERD